MACSIHSHFFKKENSTLTPKDFQAKGILAKEVENGFIEVAVNEQALRFKNEQLTEQIFQKEQERFFDVVIGSLKPNTPPLMFLYSNGDYDDFAVYIKEIDPVTRKGKKIYKNENIQNVFSKYYGDLPYFDTVGFSRYTSDIVTKEQIEEIKEIVRFKEMAVYNDWLKEQNDPSESSFLRLLLEVSAKHTAYSWKYSRDEKEKNLKELELTIKHINIFLGLPYESEDIHVRGA